MYYSVVANQGQPLYIHIMFYSVVGANRGQLLHMDFNGGVRGQINLSAKTVKPVFEGDTIYNKRTHGCTDTIYKAKRRAFCCSVFRIV